MAETKNSVCADEKCTLCLACLNACPKNAIYVDTDENGYEKVCIDSSKCVDCGICEQVCQRRKMLCWNTPAKTYAAQAADKDALGRSASGGAFQMLAQIILERQGVCYGCELTKIEGAYGARHVRIDNVNQLPRILNSKYIPSMIGNAFHQAKQDLEAGRLVLFSGTPCQIQGLRAYLNKVYDNLLTADLICHGVTSAKLFNHYIRCLEQKEDIEIVDYAFRDKTVSWGTNFRYSYLKKADSRKQIRIKHCPREESSYMMHYLRGDIFRENCYECDCANAARFSDFTLGDYWEIEREHPEYILKGKPRMVLRRGISCILVNTEKGSSLVSALAEKMILRVVALESVAAHNGNLRRPSGRGRRRDWFLKSFREEGYEVIEDTYRKKIGNKMLLYRIKNLLKSHLPDFIRIWIYQSPVLRKIVFHR